MKHKQIKSDVKFERDAKKKERKKNLNLCKINI